MAPRVFSRAGQIYRPGLPAGFANPPAGRYDIWVGTYDASSHNPAILHVTELDTNHP